MNQYVGKKLKEFRKRKKMTQKDVGKILGVAQNTVAGYETGQYELTYNNLYKLAKAFDVSVDDFFPPTTGEKNILNQLSKLAESKDLDFEDVMLIREISEKYLSLEEEDRKKLMDSIKLAVDLFDKINK